MSDLGTLIAGSAGSVESLQNNDAFSTTNTRLLNFLARTSAIGQSNVAAADVIDPLQTFDVEFKFYPSLNDSPGKNYDFDIESENLRLNSNISNASLKTKSLQNELNLLKNNTSLTLAEAKAKEKEIKDKLELAQIEEQEARESAAIAKSLLASKKALILKANSQSGNKTSFLYNLVNTIYANSPENGYANQLILQLGYYILSMTIPLITMPEAGKVPTLFGEFPVNNLYAKPDNNTFVMSLLNTKVSIHDFIFYPWMREVTLPVWSYDKQPYTTATVTVKFDKHCNTRYVFCGCRPSLIASRLPTLAPEGEPTRDVTMLFDYMFITEAKTNEYTYRTSALELTSNFYKNYNSLQEKIIL